MNINFLTPTDFSNGQQEELEVHLGGGVLSHSGLKSSSNDKTINADKKTSTELEPYNMLKKEVDQEPNNIDKWDELFKALDQHLDEMYGMGKKDIDDDFKTFVLKCYNQLCNRFPYLTNYWKNFLIIEYKLNGVDRSIDILAHSISACPYSIDLWADYLSALVSQYDISQDNGTLSEKLAFIRDQFEDSLSYNEYHFMSHPIWDRYLDFESSVNGEEKNRRLLVICMRAIKIALYNYAEYYKRFTEISKLFSIKELIGIDEEFDSMVKEYSNEAGIDRIENLTIADEHKILDEYSYTIFARTQRSVNEKWKFESELSMTEFSLRHIGDIESELKIWLEYLDFEITKYNAILEGDGNKKGQSKLVHNLFERSLIPNCLDSKLWLKFISFIFYSENDEEEKCTKLEAIYDRANFKFVPVNDNNVRSSYQLFLLKYNKFSQCMDYSFDLLRMLGGFKNNSYIFKEGYLETMNSILNIWTKVISKDRMVNVLEELVYPFLNREELNTKKEHILLTKDSIEHEDLNASSNENQVGDEEESTVHTEEAIIFSNNYPRMLYELINDTSVSLVVCYYLQYLWLNFENLAKKIRKFFNEFYRSPPLQNSVRFWYFFVQYEGSVQHNMANLRVIIRYIKENTQLPKTAIDGILSLHYDILSANSAEALKLNSNTVRNENSLIHLDNDISNSLVLNASARRRLSKHNYAIHISDQDKNARQQPRGLNKGKSGSNRDEDLLKLAKRHSDHPGILNEHAPEITNSLLRQDHFVKLNDPNITVPPFPTFKNVEKASVPVSYPSL